MVICTGPAAFRMLLSEMIEVEEGSPGDRYDNIAGSMGRIKHRVDLLAR